MKKSLSIALLLAAVSSTALAEAQFDILVSDMVDNIDCFNAETCGPVTATAQVQETLGFPNGVIHDVPVWWSEDDPDGLPLAYHFVLQGDDLFDGSGSVISFTVDWAGPGFEYSFTETWDQFLQIYTDGIAPIPGSSETIPVDDGCVPVSNDWTHANFPTGILLSEDFILDEGSTLFVEAGMEVYVNTGVSIVLNGTIDAIGDWENWITFSGDGWAGITVGPTGEGDIDFAAITGVVDDSDGGALYLESGSSLWLNNCLIAGNSTTAMGGAAYLEAGAHLHLRSCTVSHNNADMGGGNIYLADGGLISGSYNLVTFGTPESMVAETGNLFGNLQSSNVYPLDDPDQGTGWYCDPGYMDTDEGDFTISFWSLENPDQRNCAIDVSLIPGEYDPDGTSKDMGAFPFNQYEVLQPASIVAVMDNPNDQGGMVHLVFDASPNDGSMINPITFYNVWVLYPGAEDYINSGQSVGAMGEEAYMVSVATVADSMGTDSLTYGHSFIVSAHNSMDPSLVALSNEGWGFSIDNIAPGVVTGMATAEDWEDDQAGNISMDFSWDVNTANDFDHFEVYVGTEDIFENATLVSEQLETSYTHVAADEDEGTVFYYFVRALDHNGNVGATTSVNSPAATDVENFIPTSFDLAQNFPNPFNPSTTIRFDIAQAGNVSLRIFNMQGQMVSELVNGFQDVGRYELSFDASALASGVYLYHLEADNFVETRKMVLMK